ncbi:MAG: FliA/WhiG family RNA polymerase sigma factor [Planctomycetaceae bacterium]|nr:FliA/WhiG family RNA polymerase sigma factor [Planctomycetaceae bacterium]MBQ2822926.1 FliA/WhiG family RNA polymerase sigma factor [Thermoguttaceae bacterium]
MEESMVAVNSNSEAVAQWWEEYKMDPQNQETRNLLVENYLPLVRYHAQKVWQRLPDGVELDDLVSAGVFGLMDAIDAFDLTRDVKFETYCAPRIRGAMLDELRNMDWVPRLVRTKAKRINEATKELDDKLGRKPTDEELADYLGVSADEFEKMAKEANTASVVSLNKKWCETDGSKEVSELDVLEDQRGEDPTSRLQKIDTMRLVTKGLKRNERLILLLYYYQDMTMKEIGMTLDLSESRVSQIHSSIVQRLQGTLSERKPEFTV